MCKAVDVALTDVEPIKPSADSRASIELGCDLEGSQSQNRLCRRNLPGAWYRLQGSKDSVFLSGNKVSAS
jgi:hypothetical protein